MKNPADDVAALLRAVAARGVSRTASLPASVDDATLSLLLQAADAASLSGLLGDAIRDGAIALTELQRSAVTTWHRDVMGHALMVESTLLHLCDRLDADGVRYAVLKGVALCHGLYRRPDIRTFVDADVLIHPDDLDRALSAAASADFRRVMPEIRPGFDRRFAKDITLVRHGFPVDVHRTLIGGPLAPRVPLRALFERRRFIELAGRSVPVLDELDQLMHAALSAGAADDPPRLITLRDLVELESRLRPTATAMRERAAEWGITSVLARAVLAAERTIEPDVPSVCADWARDHRGGRLERLMLSTYVGPNRGPRRAVASLATLRPRSHVFGYLAAIAWPDRRYLEARGLTRRSHVVGGVRRLVRRTR